MKEKLTSHQKKELIKLFVQWTWDTKNNYHRWDQDIFGIVLKEYLLKMDKWKASARGKTAPRDAQKEKLF